MRIMKMTIKATTMRMIIRELLTPSDVENDTDDVWTWLGVSPGGEVARNENDFGLKKLSFW